MLMRKRNRKVKLTNRIGSRRNRLLIITIFSLLVAAVWVSGVGSTPSGNNFLIARTDLSSYTQLSQDNSDSMQIDLKDEATKYVQSNSKMSSWFLAKPVRAGELIPVTSVIAEPISNCTAMKITLGMSLNSNIHTGDQLDIWSGQTSYTPNSIPIQIVSRAELLNAKTSTDALSQSVQTIEVCVNQAEVRSVVNAIAQKLVVIAVLAK